MGFAKRLIGRKFADPIVQADIKLWPFKVVAGAGDKPMIEVNFQGEEKWHIVEAKARSLHESIGIAARLEMLESRLQELEHELLKKTSEDADEKAQQGREKTSVEKNVYFAIKQFSDLKPAKVLTFTAEEAVTLAKAANVRRADGKSSCSSQSFSTAREAGTASAS